MKRGISMESDFLRPLLKTFYPSVSHSQANDLSLWWIMRKFIWSFLLMLSACNEMFWYCTYHLTLLTSILLSCASMRQRWNSRGITVSEYYLLMSALVNYLEIAYSLAWLQTSHATCLSNVTFMFLMKKGLGQRVKLKSLSFMIAFC